MTIDEHAAAAKEHLRQMVKEIETELGFNTALPLLQAMDAIDRVAGKWARLKQLSGELCTEHRNYNGCELPLGHDGPHKSGGLSWNRL